MQRLCIPGIFLALVFAVGVLAPWRVSEAGDYSDVVRHVPQQWKDDVARVLDLASADWNDDELIGALSAYPPGSPKFRAVCYLIANMDKHVYVDYVNPDDPLNPFSPEDKDIDWVREYVWDYSTMTSDLLIENVEWAFAARERFAWCRDLPEHVFLDYVLPYRSTQEPLHSWRPMMFERFVSMLSGQKTALDVAELVNTYNTGIFHFDPLYYRHPEDRDIPTLLSCGSGRCEDMSNLSNYSVRAVGVPTTSDFTPRWPKGDNNHAWNVVFSGGKWYSFMGCEARTDPTWDAIRTSVFAKVYRESFSAEPIMGPAPDGTQPPRLMRTPAIDVTSEYTTVSDISLRVMNPARATYLCVFNFGDWQDVAGAWAEGENVTFRDVGNQDILYCATRYVEDETGWGTHYPVAIPFVLHLDGNVDYTDPCPQAVPDSDIVLTGWNASSILEDGKEVTLFRYVKCEDPEAPSPMEWKARATIVTTPEGDNVSATFPATAIEGGLFLLSDSTDPAAFREGSRPFVWHRDGIVYY